MIDLSRVTSWTIPVGGVQRDVRRVSIGGVTIWTQPNPLPYVMDGLIAWYDGIWNAGIGVHDGTATTWTNLVDGDTVALGPYMEFAADGVRCTSERTTGIITGIAASGIHCIEAVGDLDRVTSPTFYVLSSQQKTIIPYVGTETLLTNNSRGMSVSLLGLHSVSVNYGSIAESAHVDGQAVAVGTSARNISSGSFQGVVRIGGRYSANLGATGTYHCIRVYNRQLTVAEVAANYAADRERFGI